MKLEGQGRGIVMGVTRLLLQGHFTPYRPKRTKHFWGECKLARPGQGVADLCFEKAFDIVGFSTVHSCEHRS